MSGSMFDNVVLLSLRLSALGITRKLPSSTIEVDADKDMLHLSKDILESKAYKKIKKHDGKTRVLIDQRSVPSMFRSGIYAIKVQMVEDIDALLTKRQAERAILVESFLAEYKQCQEEAKRRLNSLFRLTDYPEPDIVRSKFGFSYSFIEFSTPGSLQSVNREIWEREKAKASETWQNAIEEGLVLLRSEFADLVSHLAERLSPGEDGTKKIFRDSAVQKVKEWADLFRARDIAGDEELARLVSETQAIMQGIEPKALRNDDQLRESVKADMERFKAQADSLVINAPKRKFRLSAETEGDEWGVL